MPKRGKRSDDLSPGDGRAPFSDSGGVMARHARTHDVRREQLTDPQGPDRGDDEFADDIAPATPSRDLHTHADESRSAAEDRGLHARFQGLGAEELGRLPIVAAGARLEQGGTYLNLDNLARGPFTAMGGQEATLGSRYVAKKDVDYELWNRLTERAGAAALARPRQAGREAAGG